MPGFFFCFAIADTFPLLPSCTCAERAGKVNVVPCSCCTKKYSIQEFSSSVVCAACLHICKTYRTVWRVRHFVYSSLSCLCLRFSVCVFFFSSISKRHLLVSYSSLSASSPGSSGAVVIGNVLSGRQSCVAPRPSCCRPTTPSTLHRVSLARLPLRGVSPEGAPVLSEPLDVPVFLAEDGDLVLEEDGVQSHLGVDQWHGAKPAGELVHAGLPLGEVVRIGPARSPRRLKEARQRNNFRVLLSVL